MTKQNDIIKEKNEEKKLENEQKEKIGTQSVHKEEVERLQEKVQELENKYKRALADYQNLEKRTQEARRELVKSANKDLVLRLLPVLDTLLLAQRHVKDQGIELSIQQFLSTLKEEGIKKVETLEKKFDPLLMECVETIDGAEEKVLEELRAGYTMFEKVIRPAQVKVGKTIYTD